MNLGSGQSLLAQRTRTHRLFGIQGRRPEPDARVGRRARAAIRANTVCPGLVDTPMAEGVQGNVGNYALRRLAQPVEIANAILFLTSSESSYVTGAALAVDGGRSFH